MDVLQANPTTLELAWITQETTGLRGGSRHADEGDVVYRHIRKYATLRQRSTLTVLVNPNSVLDRIAHGDVFEAHTINRSLLAVFELDVTPK